MFGRLAFMFADSRVRTVVSGHEISLMVLGAFLLIPVVTALVFLISELAARLQGRIQQHSQYDERNCFHLLLILKLLK